MKPPPTAVIAEDEAILRSELCDMLTRVWPELVVVAEAEDGIEALNGLLTHHPQILFLDIQMPGMNGLEVARQASGQCHVAFVTAYDKYAVTAFEEGAVDYVLKPFSAARLATTVSRLKSRIESTPATLDGILKLLNERAGSAREYVRWITASQGSDLRLIIVDEICYFQSDSKYTLVVTPAQTSLIRRPIKELVEELDPAIFWQIHRGAVVNVNAISGVTRDIGGHLRVSFKERTETLAISNPYVHRFKQI